MSRVPTTAYSNSRWRHKAQQGSGYRAFLASMGITDSAKQAAVIRQARQLTKQQAAAQQAQPQMPGGRSRYRRRGVMRTRQGRQGGGGATPGGAITTKALQATHVLRHWAVAQHDLQTTEAQPIRAAAAAQLPWRHRGWQGPAAAAEGWAAPSAAAYKDWEAADGLQAQGFNCAWTGVASEQVQEGNSAEDEDFAVLVFAAALAAQDAQEAAATHNGSTSTSSCSTSSTPASAGPCSILWATAVASPEAALQGEAAAAMAPSAMSGVLDMRRTTSSDHSESADDGFVLVEHGDVVPAGNATPGSGGGWEEAQTAAKPSPEAHRIQGWREAPANAPRRGFLGSGFSFRYPFQFLAAVEATTVPTGSSAAAVPHVAAKPAAEAMPPGDALAVTPAVAAVAVAAGITTSSPSCDLDLQLALQEQRLLQLDLQPPSCHLLEDRVPGHVLKSEQDFASRTPLVVDLQQLVCQAARKSRAKGVGRMQRQAGQAGARCIGTG